MTRKFQPFQKDGEMFLKEENPYLHYGASRPLCDLFEEKALSSAKPLIGNFPVKEEYCESELKIVWQYNSPDTSWTICPDNLISFKAQRAYQVREAYEYIGDPFDGIFEKEEEDGFFGLVDAVIEYRKNNPHLLSQISINAASYENGKQAERARIIGLIEAELSNAIQHDTYRRQILRNLLIKIKQS